MLRVPSVAGLVTAAVLLTPLFTRPAAAVVLHPGMAPPLYPDQDDYYRDSDPGFVPWQGEVLASRTTPFEVRIPNEEAGRDLWFRGSLRHEVIRETESGYLSFHYHLTSTGSSGDVTDFERAAAFGFGSYFTDVRAEWDTSGPPSLERSPDGNAIRYLKGDSFDHWLIVRTDAPGFAEGGRFDVQLEFLPYDEIGVASLATFQPVPEPGAAGLVLFTAAAGLLHRRRAASVPPRGVIR